MKKVALLLILILFLSPSLSSSVEKIQVPKEYGVYVKTPKKLVRLIPNIVLEEEGIYYVEMLSPPRFLLKDVEYFVIFGDYNMDVLTFNPMEFLRTTPVGKQRFLFGREIPLEVKKVKERMYKVKPKEILGRGYFSIWIEDSAWDFIIE
jgi:hypothetical protein